MSISNNIKAKINQNFKTKKKKAEALELANQLNTRNKTDETLWEEIVQNLKAS